MLCTRNCHSVVGLLYTSKSKQTHRKRDQICGYRRWGGGEKGNWMKVVKRYKIPVVK